MSLSSIFNFKTLSNPKLILKRSPLSFLTFLLFFALLDLSLRFLEPLKLYGGWEHQQVHVKLQNLKKYSEKTKIDVLLYGNSAVMSLNPKDIEQRWHEKNIHGFNAGIGGIVPETAHFILQNGILPITRPALIIYFIGPRDLRDRPHILKRHNPPMTSHIGRRIFASSRIEKLEAYVEDVSYLFGARRAIRDYITRGELPETTYITSDERGFWKQTTSMLTDKLNGKSEFPSDYFYRTRYNNYRVRDDGEYTELVKMIEYSKSEGVDFILVNMSISPACFSLFDNPREDYQIYSDAIEQVVKRTGVKYYNMHAALELQNPDFGDADHINNNGDEKAIRYINEKILSDYFSDSD